MAGYIGTTPVPQATQHRESFTATGGQTSFATAGYTPQFIDVYLNGVKLAPADYTATNGSDVVLASGATASDILEIVAYTPFEVANQTFTGDTSVTNLAVTGTFTSRGIDDNADAVAITIDSSERVGIGTSSPNTGLSVVTGSANGIELGQDSALSVDSARLFFSTSAGSNAIHSSSGAMRFFTASTAGSSSGTERMRLDSSGNVGIGTDSPASYSSAANNLVVQDTGGEGGVTIVSTNTGSSNIFFADTDALAQGQIKYQHSGDYMRFYTDGSERMRIDSSGNVLVGKTSASVAVEGAELRPTGQAILVADGTNPILMNRLTSDGDIAVFRKDGTTVGSIGTRGGHLLIGTGDVALRFSDGSDAITPQDISLNQGRDAAIDFGLSGTRFKDLYLSGGVYLGGVGAANKLDDYEEGTFTITAQPATSGSITLSGTQNTGSYTKIGRQVTLTFKTEVASTSSPVGDFQINLPFASLSQTEQADNYHGTAALQNVPYTGDYIIAQIAGGGSSVMTLLTPVAGGSWGSVSASLIGASDDIRVTITYFTP